MWTGAQAPEEGGAMQLASVRPDDIVRVNKKGRVFEALVLAKREGQLEIEPLQRGITYTTASAREVICHWAKRGRRNRRPARPGVGPR
jgi:hypothetical protein